ncbi:MAG: hypothetical protein ABL977_16280 [Candidatus Eisenbacteria bacterium]
MVPAPRRPTAGSKPASNASDRARRRRVAAKRAGRDARVLLCERTSKGPTRKLLQQLHFNLVVCHALEEALRETAKHTVDVVVVVMEQDHGECVGLLQLLRRALPRTPFVLVLDDPTPAARLATLTVRPFYVAVPPVGPDEMAAVLRDALAASRKKK